MNVSESSTAGTGSVSSIYSGPPTVQPTGSAFGFRVQHSSQTVDCIIPQPSENPQHLGMQAGIQSSVSQYPKTCEAKSESNWFRSSTNLCWANQGGVMDSFPDYPSSVNPVLRTPDFNVNYSGPPGAGNMSLLSALMDRPRSSYSSSGIFDPMSPFEGRGSSQYGKCSVSRAEASGGARGGVPSDTCPITHHYRSANLYSANPGGVMGSCLGYSSVPPMAEMSDFKINYSGRPWSGIISQFPAFPDNPGVRYSDSQYPVSPFNESRSFQYADYSVGMSGVNPGYGSDVLGEESLGNESTGGGLQDASPALNLSENVHKLEAEGSEAEGSEAEDSEAEGAEECSQDIKPAVFSKAPNKSKINVYQREALERIYQQTQYPSRVAKGDFSQLLGITVNQVNSWFKLRRAKERKLMNSSTISGGIPGSGDISGSKVNKSKKLRLGHGSKALEEKNDPNAKLSENVKEMATGRGEACDNSNNAATSETSKYTAKKKARATFTTSQLEALEKKFSENMAISGTEKHELAEKIGLTFSQVSVWFHNRRAKFRRLSKKNSSIPDVRRRKVNQETGQSFYQQSYLTPSSHDSHLQQLFSHGPGSSASTAPSAPVSSASGGVPTDK